VAFVPEFITSFVTENREIDGFRVLEGVPEGAQFVNAYYDARYNALVAVYTHPSWELVYSLDECPSVRVAFTPLQAEQAHEPVTSGEISPLSLDA